MYKLCFDSRNASAYYPGTTMFRVRSFFRIDMKNTSAQRLLGLGLMMGCVFPSLAMPVRHPHRQAQDQIATLEQEWRSATLEADAGTLEKLLSDDFVGISWTGQVNTKAMQLDRVRSRKLQLSRLDITDRKIKILPGAAIVTSTAHIEGTNEGAAMTGIFRYTRVYQRTASGTWKITNFEATRVPDPR